MNDRSLSQNRGIWWISKGSCRMEQTITFIKISLLCIVCWRSFTQNPILHGNPRFQYTDPPHNLRVNDREWLHTLILNQILHIFQFSDAKLHHSKLIEIDDDILKFFFLVDDMAELFPCILCMYSMQLLIVW